MTVSSRHALQVPANTGKRGFASGREVRGFFFEGDARVHALIFVN